MYKHLLAASLAAAACAASAATSVAVSSPSPEVSWSTYSGDNSGCALVLDCNLVSVFTLPGVNRQISFSVDFFISEPNAALAFRLAHDGDILGFPISVSRTDWQVTVSDLGSGAQIASKSFSTDAWYDSDFFAMNISSYANTTLRASFTANVFAGYSLITSSDPFCNSIFCMPVVQRQIAPRALVAVGAVPEPSIALMGVPALAVAAFLARRRKPA